MAVLFRVLALLAALSGAALAHNSRVCPADSPLSCHNTTVVDDTCCFIPAGQLLLTQFWDADPPTGPSDSWTLHGLWPDNCDGSYPARCDSSRSYTDISAILRDAGADDTLSYMQEYWKDYKGNDESLWKHEWAKHGTCISTLEPRCFSPYRRADEAVAYFNRAVNLFKALPTHKWLADAGIVPSGSKKYSLDSIQDVLERQHGASVTLKCRGAAINEVWYHYNVRGSLQAGQFVAAEPDGAKGRCPDQVQYKVKE